MSELDERRQLDRSLEQLTLREREVLDHLVRHKTSKQIALDLNIHENTVNKHLASVREKWGLIDRYETARVFSELAGDENHPPKIPPGDDCLSMRADAFADLPDSAEFRLSDVASHEVFRYPDNIPPKGLGALDARFGLAWRIVAIPVLAILIGMVVIVTLAIARALSELL